MSSVSNHSNVNSGHEVPSLEQFPEISDTSLKIFQEQQFKLPFQLLELKACVADLTTVQERLLKAEEHPTRDKIISMLATLFSLTLVAGAILGAYYGIKSGTDTGILIGVATPIVTLSLVYLLHVFYDYKYSDDGGGTLFFENLGISYPFVISLLGAFIPMWRTFRNISRYQNESKELETKVQNEMSKLKAACESSQQAPRLKEILQNDLKKHKTLLQQMQTLLAKSPEAIEALEATQKITLQALTDLEHVFNFYTEHLST